MSNVFFYRSADALGTAQNLSAVWKEPGNIANLVNQVQTTIAKNLSVKVINLYSDTDFYEDGHTGTGAIADDALPMHSAVNFALKIDTRALRPGSKRFSAIAELNQSNGIIGGVGVIEGFNNIAIALAADLESADPLAVYEPVVVKRIEYTIDEGEETEHQSYRLPTTALETVFGNVTVALLNTHVSHQVSRGNGR